MATLSANKVRDFEMEGFAEYPVVATDIIYAGAAVSLTSGNARPLNTSDTFVGFCMAKADNASGSAGDINVTVRTKGKIKLSVTGVTGVGDVGSDVYATDDDTFTLTASGGLAIGTVHRYISGTTAIVAYEGAQERSI